MTAIDDKCNCADFTSRWNEWFKTYHKPKAQKHGKEKKKISRVPKRENKER
jgi:sterol desaturase/sphingolipid hydroxylase (fatty acid hydroxylase superfamily)